MGTEHNPSSSKPPHSPTAGRDIASTIEVLARGLLFHGERVLLCRNVKHGYRYLPGGHVEPGEAAATALAREFLEESGVAVRVGELVCVTEGGFIQKGRPRHEMNLVFHVELAADAPTTAPAAFPSLEPGIAFDWVALSDIPGADLRPGAIRDWVISRVKAGNPGAAGRPCGWLSDGLA